MSSSVFRGRRYPAWLAAGLVGCSSIGCALGGASTYPEGAPASKAVDVPERFVSEDLPGSAAVTDTLPGPGCRSPLIDPRDGTRLQMVNSQQRVGDYAAPEGRYGVGAGELLRVECNTGRVVGIVPDRG